MSGQTDSRIPLEFPPLWGLVVSYLNGHSLYAPPLPKLVAVLPSVSLAITVVIGSMAIDGSGVFRLYVFLFSLFCSSS